MKYIKFFEEVSIEDVGIVGGKNASLGEMYKNLTPQGILIPWGFALTADAYNLFLRENEIEKKISTVLSGLDKKDLRQLADVGHRVRSLIRGASFPVDVAAEVRQAYKLMEKNMISTVMLRFVPPQPLKICLKRHLQVNKKHS